ncbi:hypothetical protein AHAS_Ahas09G0143200 [Arachis hypogaea]
MGRMVTKKSYYSAADLVLIGAQSLGSFLNMEGIGPKGEPKTSLSALRHKRLWWRLECGPKSCPTTYSQALTSPPSQRTWPFLSSASSLRDLSTFLTSSGK